MKTRPYLSEPTAGSAIRCDILAYAAIQASATDIATLRQQLPGTWVGKSASSLLKHSDEQTLTALAALFKAITDYKLQADAFTDWGIVAAPRYLGRLAVAAAIRRFAVEGAWGVSPHLIPHRSLHSVSGTISQLLKIHGPNVGVGGGPGGAIEALSTAAALLACDRLPGVWVVMTAWLSEPEPDQNDEPAGSRLCNALALALVPAREDWAGPTIRIVTGIQNTDTNARPDGEPCLLELECLQRILTDPVKATATFIWQLDCGGYLELERRAATDKGGIRQPQEGKIDLAPILSYHT